jgi:hypothetical protein
MTRFITVEIEIAIIRVNFFAMCSEHYIYLVLEVFVAILFALNQIAIFCNSLDTYRSSSFSFFPFERQVVSSANNTGKSVVAE